MAGDVAGIVLATAVNVGAALTAGLVLSANAGMTSHWLTDRGGVRTPACRSGTQAGARFPGCGGVEWRLWGLSFVFNRRAAQGVTESSRDPVILVA